MSKCRWTFEGEFWQTECENAHVFEVDGPKENQYVYCPYCGKEIVVKEIKEPMTLRECQAEFLLRNDIEKHTGKNSPTSANLIFETISDHFWMAAVENERLKHEPKQSFKEWWSPEKICPYGECKLYHLECEQCKGFAKLSWNACAKNRGYGDYE